MGVFNKFCSPHQNIYFLITSTKAILSREKKNKLLCLIALLSGRPNMRSEKTYSNVSEMLIEKIFGLNYQIASGLHANRRLKRMRL